MTIETTHRRRAAACLVAGIGVLLALMWASGDAQGATPDRELRAALRDSPPGAKVISPTRAHWPRQGVTLELKATKAAAGYCQTWRLCLWEHRDQGGRMIYFDKRGTFKLSAWSMGPNPSRHKGASSYANFRSVPATLIGPNFRHNMAQDMLHHNIPSSMNDRATYVQVGR